MKYLRMGETLRFPAQEATTQTIVAYGAKGMGKTNLAAVLCEELQAHQQRFSLLDPVGVSWGLRHAADGKGPGLDILILGGRHGDVPIEPTGGAVIADLVADEEIDTLIDISSKPDGRRWSQGEKIRFVADYIERLLQRQGERRRPLMQIIDEAARFAPQTYAARDTDITRCVGAMNVLVEEGRNSGVGVALITQRSARMAKSVSELAELMIAFRTIGPNSVDAILDWFGEHVPKARWNDLVEQLRKLPRGEALIVSPGWLQFEGTAKFRKRWTFDSSETPSGTEQKLAKRHARPDLDHYRSRLAATVQKAQSDDPRHLRKTIQSQEVVIAKMAATLEKQNGSTLQSKSYPDQVRERDQAIREVVTLMNRREKTLRAALSLAKDALEQGPFRVEQRIREVLDQATRRVDESLKAVDSGMARALAQVNAALTATEATVAAAPTPPPSTPVRDPESHRPVPAMQASEPIARALKVEVDGQAIVMAPIHRKILNVLAEFNDMGVWAPPRTLVAAFSGYDHFRSKGFANAVGALSSGGLISYPTAGAMSLTAAGARVADGRGRPSSVEELRQRIVQVLGPKVDEILGPLVMAWPGDCARDDLAGKAGYGHVRSKGFANQLGRLSSLGFLTYPSQGRVRATPLLMMQEGS